MFEITRKQYFKKCIEIYCSLFYCKFYFTIIFALLCEGLCLEVQGIKLVKLPFAVDICFIENYNFADKQPNYFWGSRQTLSEASNTSWIEQWESRSHRLDHVKISLKYFQKFML